MPYFFFLLLFFHHQQYQINNQNHQKKPPLVTYLNSMEIHNQDDVVGLLFNPSSSSSSSFPAKAKIMSHPHYHRLLSAFVNCQKVGAPAEVVARLEEACEYAAAMGAEMRPTSNLGEDPGLDQFMEAYCEMLIKFEQELSKPIKEAMAFLQTVQSQFQALSLTSTSSSSSSQYLQRNHP